jgi:hypothetical protein
MILKKLTRLLSKTKMENTVQEQQKQLFYVWTKTERAGQIVSPILEQNDPKWLKFTDGTRVNKSLVKEYLLLAPTEKEANSMAQTLGLTAMNSFDSPNATTATEPITAPVVIKEEPKVEYKSEPKAEINVMMEMLKKMSKKNTAAMTVNVNIPAVEVYEMLKDQMDVTAEDLNENIVALVESQINNLKEQLNEQITTFIINYYNNGTTNTTSPEQKTEKSDSTPKRNTKSSKDSGL